MGLPERDDWPRAETLIQLHNAGRKGERVHALDETLNDASSVIFWKHPVPPPHIQTGKPVKCVGPSLAALRQA